MRNIPVVVAVAVGGVVGALARYGLSTLWPSVWTVWAINVTGCFLIGVLTVLITRRRPESRLIRPFWTTGVLGGYTTFSTASVDVVRATPATALALLGATIVSALLAVWLGTALAERVVAR
ncbi:fluoride efflux transporter FluC [Winogradskya consettensis]|uniref:Fluoride-specific ion channel FluC n=1 Tax=Winogradskya consettensis TaxID=113560 RepID=A0A919SVK9_9ACTN|nr:CrcB family protein [Actinoplanes consettensis]GIM77843.1 putative fluoride ion transporter CrcB 1 [Actinoplanes consettensis]